MSANREVMFLPDGFPLGKQGDRPPVRLVLDESDLEISPELLPELNEALSTPDMRPYDWAEEGTEDAYSYRQLEESLYYATPFLLVAKAGQVYDFENEEEERLRRAEAEVDDRIAALEQDFAEILPHPGIAELVRRSAEVQMINEVRRNHPDEPVEIYFD